MSLIEEIILFELELYGTRVHTSVLKRIIDTRYSPGIATDSDVLRVFSENSYRVRKIAPGLYQPSARTVLSEEKKIEIRRVFRDRLNRENSRVRAISPSKSSFPKALSHRKIRVRAKLLKIHDTITSYIEENAANGNSRIGTLYIRHKIFSHKGATAPSSLNVELYLFDSFATPRSDKVGELMDTKNSIFYQGFAHHEKRGRFQRYNALIVGAGRRSVNPISNLYLPQKLFSSNIVAKVAGVVIRGIS